MVHTHTSEHRFFDLNLEITADRLQHRSTLNSFAKTQGSHTGDQQYENLLD